MVNSFFDELFMVVLLSYILSGPLYNSYTWLFLWPETVCSFGSGKQKELSVAAWFFSPG